jgi:hypothetical protein
MTWEDVFFSRNVDPKDIIKALSCIFEIEEQEIVIEYGWGWHDGLDVDHISMLCRLDIIRGDFPIRLEFGFWSGWKKAIPQDSERYSIVGRLCDSLNNPALVTGDADSPFISVLIQGEGDYQYVHLDPDKEAQPTELMELEIDDYLYKFSHPLPKLELELGNLITRKDLDEVDFRDSVSSHSAKTSKEELFRTLNNIRSEAKRMYREDLIQEVIDSLEQS